MKRGAEGCNGPWHGAWPNHCRGPAPSGSPCVSIWGRGNGPAVGRIEQASVPAWPCCDGNKTLRPPLARLGIQGPREPGFTLGPQPGGCPAKLQGASLAVSPSLALHWLGGRPERPPGSGGCQSCGHRAGWGWPWRVSHGRGSFCQWRPGPAQAGWPLPCRAPLALCPWPAGPGESLARRHLADRNPRPHHLRFKGRPRLERAPDLFFRARIPKGLLGPATAPVGPVAGPGSGGPESEGPFGARPSPRCRGWAAKRRFELGDAAFCWWGRENHAP